MEKLQIAMEKARQQRHSMRTPFPMPSEGTVSEKTQPAGQPFIDITRIEKLEPRPRLFKRNRIVTAPANNGKTSKNDRFAAEAFRIARTHLLQMLESGSGHAVLVTSALQGDGKTLITLNMAMGLARHPRYRVLMIDGDLRRPNLARTLGIKPAHDLADYLEGKAAIEQCTYDLGIDKLLCIPQTRSVRNSSELLAGQRFSELLKNIKQHHPDWIIIIDGPPILAVDDALVLRQHADGCLLVVKEGVTRRDEMRKAAELIGEEKFLGTVLNFADFRFHTYYAHQYSY